jgi:hypothetical protein
LPSVSTVAAFKFVGDGVVEITQSNGRIYYADLRPAAITFTSLSQVLKDQSINDYYNLYLGRTAAFGEILIWRSYSVEQLRQGILNSNEYLVKQLYRDALAREGAPSEINAWLNFLAAGATRDQVVLAIFNSPESRSKNTFIPQAASTYLAIRNLYSDVLNRQPDRSGLIVWMKTLQSGTSLVAIRNAFLTSTELSLKINAFAVSEYQRIFRRAVTLAEALHLRNIIIGGLATFANVTDSLIANLGY